MSEIADFYDAWAVDYDAAFADWRAAMSVHGAALAAALAERDLAPPSRVLDCTCGIGTQAIALSLAGFSVRGSDISRAEVERAGAEAARLGTSVEFAVADLLDLPATLPDDDAWRGFDAVLSANSLTHLADEASLSRAFQQMATVARPGGIVAVTNRDYDTLGQPTSTALQRSVAGGTQRISFQLWDWAADGRSYCMEDVLLTRRADDESATWTVRSRSTTLHAWRRADIERAAAAAGLVDPVWTTTTWQPVATLRTPT